MSDYVVVVNSPDGNDLRVYGPFIQEDGQAFIDEIEDEFEILRLGRHRIGAAVLRKIHTHDIEAAMDYMQGRFANTAAKREP